MVVALALAASLVIGFSDYLGGVGSRHRPAVAVAFWMQLTTALLLPVAAVSLGWDGLHRADLLVGFLGGLGAGLAYLLFLHGMAHGRMSVIAPLTAITTAVVPVAGDVLTGVHLRPLAWVGIVLAAVSIPLLTYRPSPSSATTMPRSRQVALAVTAGALFAVFFIAMGHTSEDSGSWPIAMAGLAGTLAAAGACAGTRQRVGRPTGLGVAAGLLAVVSGVCIARALQIGPISIATVLGSLYPLVTTACAARFDHEPLIPPNVAGVALAVGGAAVLAAAR